MSVSLYRWTPECDMSICPGDCDLCTKNEEVDDEQTPLHLRPRQI